MMGHSPCHNWIKWKTPKQGNGEGPGGVHVKAFENCALDKILMGVGNKELMNGDVPSQWSLLAIMPVPVLGVVTQWFRIELEML